MYLRMVQCFLCRCEVRWASEFSIRVKNSVSFFYNDKTSTEFSVWASCPWVGVVFLVSLKDAVMLASMDAVLLGVDNRGGHSWVDESYGDT